MDDGRGRDRVETAVADARVLGRLLAAQSALSLLPSPPQAADLCAQALSSVPGVCAASICLPGAFSRRPAQGQEPAGEDVCASCEDPRRRSGEGGTISPAFACRAGGAPRACAVPLEAAGDRFGFAVLEVERPEVFEAYQPGVEGLASCLALALEGRRRGLGPPGAREERGSGEGGRADALAAALGRLEEEVERRRRAEAEVGERNRELEERLGASLDELEAFAHSVSHDLRAPLRHIAGFLDLLEKRLSGSLDPQGRHYLDAVLEAAEHMNELIDGLVAFSRAGRGQLDEVQVDLGELAREVVGELEPQARGRAVSWRIGPLPRVTGDRALLKLALASLLSNALKFTRPRAEAEIDLGCEDGPPDEWVVFVRDNGVGFDMAHAGKLFGVFERLHPRSEFEGTGMGLANLRRIVRRHGGRTWAEGAVGRGAKFSLSLPRR